jgi:hypothetical protein
MLGYEALPRNNIQPLGDILPIFESLPPPQHGHEVGAGCMMRRRSRSARKLRRVLEVRRGRIGGC